MIFFVHFINECRLFIHVSLSYIAIGFLWLRFGWSLVNIEKVMTDLNNISAENEWYKVFIEQNFDIITDQENTKYSKDRLN